MANKHMQRLSASVNKEMQIGITMRNHFIATKMAIIKKIDTSNCY